MDQPDRSTEKRSFLWLPRDQTTLAVLALLWLLGTAGWYVGRLAVGSRTVEFEQAPKLRYSFVVDVNEADWPELAQLPGIGETLARRIVDSREVEGPFLDHADLLRVRGIGPRTLEGIRPYLAPIPPGAAVAER